MRKLLDRNYRTLPNDGALYRCRECKKLKEYSEVIKPVQPDPFGVVCLNCVDVSNVQCIGTHKL